MSGGVAPVRSTRRPFTLILCTACGDDRGAAALDGVRATIRRCDHGVLVTTGCMLGTKACTSGGGVTMVLQPCTIDRRPDGPPRWLGAIDGARDVRAVCRWVERGDWDSPPPGCRPSAPWEMNRRVGSPN